MTLEPITCRILVVVRAGSVPPIHGWRCLDCGRERDPQWETRETAYTDAANEHLRQGPRCPSRAPESGEPCVEVDAQDAHPIGLHASKRKGVTRSVWPPTTGDLARWRHAATR
jgi:hypothetical protein